MGLRAGEVAGLRLDDIDWRLGEITVRGKGNRRDRLPLPTDAGEAVVAYLADGRPSTALDRSVFIRIKAPHRGLTSGGVTQAVAAAAGRAGLGVIYAHRLRHSAAWTNNVSEQGAKAAKRHQAVSGYWHTQQTLARWCRIRSYLDSATAHGITALDAITAALAGKPWLPLPTVPAAA